MNNEDQAQCGQERFSSSVNKKDQAQLLTRTTKLKCGQESPSSSVNNEDQAHCGHERLSSSVDKKDQAQVLTRKTKLNCGQERPSSSVDKKDQDQVRTSKIQIYC